MTISINTTTVICCTMLYCYVTRSTFIFLVLTHPPSYLFHTFTRIQVGRVGGVNRREVGHGNLAERALIPCIPDVSAFPYSIRAESLITESCGSSRYVLSAKSTYSLLFSFCFYSPFICIFWQCFKFTPYLFVSRLYSYFIIFQIVDNCALFCCLFSAFFLSHPLLKPFSKWLNNWCITLLFPLTPPFLSSVWPPCVGAV